jgi:V/A-type H+-transporting ATPase subunit B
VITKEYRTARQIIGPLVLLEGVEGVTYGELTDIKEPDGSLRRGRFSKSTATRPFVQVFEGTSGLAPESIAVKFLGKGM